MKVVLFSLFPLSVVELSLEDSLVEVVSIATHLQTFEIHQFSMFQENHPINVIISKYMYMYMYNVHVY